MLKFLSALLTLFNRLLAAWDAKNLREQGRLEAEKEAAHEVQRQVELAEHAVDAVDPERTERLRNRFDRSRSSK